MVDVLADTINKIKGYEGTGRYECIVPSTKLIRAVLETMKKNNYIADYQEFKDGKFSRVKVTMAKKINDIGVIKPRYPVTVADYQKFEQRFIPSANFGILIVSTSKGIVTNKEAKTQNLGGRLIAYVY